MQMQRMAMLGVGGMSGNGNINPVMPIAASLPPTIIGSAGVNGNGDAGNPAPQQTRARNNRESGMVGMQYGMLGASTPARQTLRDTSSSSPGDRGGW